MGSVMSTAQTSHSGDISLYEHLTFILILLLIKKARPPPLDGRSNRKDWKLFKWNKLCTDSHVSCNAIISGANLEVKYTKSVDAEWIDRQFQWRILSDPMVSKELLPL